MKSCDIEIAVAKKFNFRRNIIVPNVSWGLLKYHEADLLIVTKSGYATEIEIKVSASDIRADLKKKHGHVDHKIKYVYFAVPEELAGHADIPRHFGLISVSNYGRCTILRRSESNRSAVKLTEKEINHLLHLGCMRIWLLKKKIIKLRNMK